MSEVKPHVKFYMPHELGWLRCKAHDFTAGLIRMQVWERPDGSLISIIPGALIPVNKGHPPKE